MPLTFADIEGEFDQSLGYVRQDIAWLRAHNSGLNYTIALLIGCGCEMLAAAGGDKNRHGETVLAEMLPAGDWRLLAERLYTALRDGLAHGFDTKHLEVDGQSIQIYLAWNNSDLVLIKAVTHGLGLYIGMKPLSEALIRKIDDFEALLQADEDARERFKKAHEYQRKAPLGTKESESWRRLVTAAGYKP